MISYATFCRLRQLRDQDRLDISQIAAELRIHRQTVATWINRQEYQRRAVSRKRTPSPIRTCGMTTT